MARTIILDGSLIVEETQVIETMSIDDELKTKIIVLKDTTDIEPYDMDLTVVITENAVAEYYKTAYDSVVLTGRSPKTYTHTLTVIEAIKDFERITMSSLQYTQGVDTIDYTLLDVVDRALKLIDLEEFTLRGSKRVYDISGIGARNSFDQYIPANLSGLALELYERKSPEIKFNTTTLKELFDQVFLLLNGRPVMESFTVVGIQYYNLEGNEILLSEVEEITGNQSIEKFAQKYDIYMENAISESNVNKQALVYPSADGWASVRSSATELTTSNFLMEVPEDIERVLKFEILADVEINYDESNGSIVNQLQFSGELEVDATALLFTERAREGLDYEFSIADTTGLDTAFWKNSYLNNSLYFSGKQILGWHDNVDIFSPFGSVKLWHLFLDSIAYQQDKLPLTAGYWIAAIGTISLLQPRKPSFNTNVRDFMYRLTYVPKQTVRVQIEKDKQGAIGTLFANQTDRIVDSEMLGQNLQNKLNREGNKELQFTKKVVNYLNSFELGDYYGDYKVTKVNNDRQEQYTVSTATLSKDYAKRSERMTIANMPRQTQISAENTVRNDIYNEYVEISTSSNTNNTYLTNLGIDRYMDTFRDTNSYPNPVEIAQVSMTEDVIIPCVSQGLGKVINLKWGFDNNISAGVKTSQLDTIYGNKFFRYTTITGTSSTAGFTLHGGFTPNPNTFAQKAIVAQELPEYISADVTLNAKYVDVPRLNVIKDSGEVYNFSYQLTNVTSDENIYIGNKIATDNALVVKDTEAVYMYSSSTPIPFTERLEDGLTKQTIVLGVPVDSSEVKLTTTLTSNYGRLTFTTNFNNNYWAIANGNREVYMIMNKTSQGVVFINPRNKRS